MGCWELSHIRDFYQIIREKKKDLLIPSSSHFDILGFMRVLQALIRNLITKVMTLIMRQLNDLKRGRIYRVRASIDKRNVGEYDLIARDRQKYLD